MRQHVNKARAELQHEVDVLKDRLQELSDVQLSGSAALAGVEHISSQLGETRRQLGASRKLLAETRGHLFELNDRAHRLDNVLGDVRGQLVELGTHTRELDDARAAVLRETSAMVAEHAVRMERLDSRIDDCRTLVERSAVALELLFGADGRYVSRVVEDHVVRDLAAELSTMAGDGDAATAIAQAFRLLFELEIRGLGRVAGSVSNVVAKFAAITLLHPSTGDVLEIGTLFGVGAVGIARQLSRQGLDYHLTIVDPFAGHQVQPALDSAIDVSGSPATTAVVAENLALGGVGPDRFRLIEGLSTSSEIRARASDKSYGLIVIDGDHSEDVGYSDLLWAQSVAAPGALVLLDDYRDSTWPGVEAALNRYLASEESTMTLIGSAATTAFLRA